MLVTYVGRAEFKNRSHTLLFMGSGKLRGKQSHLTDSAGVVAQAH